jgi:transitional endoplasmic reticulum ATPase
MEISLTVEEALKNDVSRQIARIPHDVAEKLKVKTGDIISITNSKTTHAKVWRSHPKDVGTNMIRLDPIIRENAGVHLSGKVRISKADINVSKSCTLQLQSTRSITNKTHDFIRKNLIDKIITTGDKIPINIGFGNSIDFIVMFSEPHGPSIIDPNTNISFHDELIITGKSETTQIPEEKTSEPQIKVSYEDIGGLEEPIRKIREMVEYPLKFPEIFNRLGITPPNGVLLFGPPGTGKTLIAKAVASETSSFFTSINGPEIVSKFYGESETKLREIFEKAAKHSSAIIFIDEIDSIAPKRGGDTGEAERRLVSQLLTLMDGLNKRSNIVVIAATNRPDSIDEALRRGGRFDREIEIGVPNQEGRKSILQILTRGMPLQNDFDLDKIAEKSYGFVGADLSTLVKEAALISLSRILPEIDFSLEDPITEELLDQINVTTKDFLQALKLVIPSSTREIFSEKYQLSWDDVLGYDKIKEKLEELIIWPIKHPDLYQKLKTPLVRGILLFGPPGVGKTFLARVISAESEYNFISVSGTDFLSKYIGESEQFIKEIFVKAKSASPTLIFIDNIEVICSKKQSMEQNTVVNQLNREIDSLDEFSQILLVAATNRPDLLDASLRLPGRFEETIFIDIPKEADRKIIIKKKIQEFGKLEEKLLNQLINETAGYSVTDIIYIISEIKRNIIRRNRILKEENLGIIKDDIDYALTKINPFKEKYQLLPPNYNDISYGFD